VPVSVKVMGWVLEHSPVSVSGQRLVLLALADAAREDGTGAWPSQESLARMSRLSERQVRNCLKVLEEAGHIVRTGVSQKGTVVWNIVMQGGSPLPGENISGGGSSLPPRSGSPLPTNRPNPSLTSSPPKAPSSAKKIIEPQDEPIGFPEWLDHHVLICQRHEVPRSVPRTSTSYRSDLARTFAALLGEGYELEELKLASEGVLADDFMRGEGYTAPENVLRKTKIAKRIDEGRAWRAAQENDKYARFG
jgi:hypothetical protein